SVVLAAARAAFTFETDTRPLIVSEVSAPSETLAAPVPVRTETPPLMVPATALIVTVSSPTPAPTLTPPLTFTDVPLTVALRLPEPIELTLRLPRLTETA